MLNTNTKKRIYRINGKLYDFGTSNKSFLQVAKDLKALGIKNWYFMLEIVDYSLTAIDPYAADKDGHSTLSQDQVTRIMTECFRNPWYYLREIARIPDPGGTAIPYIANHGNIAQSWCIFHGIDSWLCLPRRKTMLSQNLVIDWKNLFNCWELLIGQSAAKNLYKIKVQRLSKTINK